MAGLLSIRQEILPPNGVEFCTSLKLTPSSIRTHDTWQAGPSTGSSQTLCNVVLARSSFLRIYELREEAADVKAVSDADRERRGKVRRDTEAVEGEVEMDTQGEGFVNMGSVKSLGVDHVASPPKIQRLHFVKEHRLHGVVTGLQAIRLRASGDDKLDRLLVSFKDAKIALLEWSSATHDLVTVSIHTYERAPQLMSLDPALYHAELRVDTQSRCAALLLPKDGLAILPFYQTQVEFESMDQDQLIARDVPYSPSFVLDLPQDVDERIQHVIDFAFLPGFANPTVAILFETQQTTTSRIAEFKDTAKLFIFTLDLITRHYPIVTIVEGLPFDCLSITPCSTTLGGVIVLTSNALIHIDQAARRVVLPVNGWNARMSDIPMQPLQPAELFRTISMEGSKAVFVDDRTLFVVLRDGAVRPVEVVSDGRAVSRLSMGDEMARTTKPSEVRMIADDLLLVGSLVGPSVLLKTIRIEEEMIDEPEHIGPSAVVDVSNTMDVDDDDDDDIYGDSKIVDSKETNGHATNAVVGTRTRSVIHLSLCDSLPASGPISAMTFSVARNGERLVAELVAATGSGHLGGFTLFQRELPSRTKKKLHAIGGTRGMWSLPIRQSKSSVAATQGEQLDTLIISTDISPSPGLSRIAVRNARNEITITTRFSGLTISAAPFFQGTAILHIVVVGNVNHIRVLEPDGSERQNIKDVDGSIPRARIRSCCIADPFIMVIREDDTLGLYVGETEKGRIRRKDMSPMGHKTSRYLTGCFFTDASDVFRLHSAANGAADGDTSTLQSVITAGQHTQWLVLCRPQGVVEIWALPKLWLVFSSASLATLEHVVRDTGDGPTLSLPDDGPKKRHEMEIDQVLVASVGESSPRPHLLVFLRSGHMAVYEAVSIPPTSDCPRDAVLLVDFVKVASATFERIEEEKEKSAISELKKISRQLIPFTTSPTPSATMSGVFFTGDQPCWIVRTDKGGTRIHVAGHHVVNAFTTCSLWESKNDFLVYSDEGPSLIEWIPDVQLHDPLPSRFVPRGRSYSNVMFEASSGLIIAASCLEAKFGLFDEESIVMWQPDASNVYEPMVECSSIELISPDGWITLDGHEFANNEVVNALDIVNLETTSTESGTKDFIAVGTTINRGEELAVKGATYIFEIAEVVADAEWGQKRWYKLRLLCRDDSKGPVTALCGLNGYLVSSMGQKIFVRAFDQDERLVGVAFLDVGVYVTSLRTLKNLLLIGDIVKSVWFVAFQEDPYKLAILAKDVRQLPAMTAEFLFADAMLGIVTGDEEGALRVYEFDPDDIESKNGQHLLCRSEFATQAEMRGSATVTVARRIKEEDMATPQARLIYGSTDGSLSTLTPLNDATFKRLLLLQGQLTRSVQHVAGLNPKAFRMVKNETVSKSLSKNVLDGRLIAEFVNLPIPRQDEFTRQIGTERGVVLSDWRELADSW